ncbi:hypothetical protein QJS10_CPB19g01805 [Acorus calamus]|uniref:Leucine-rich repeat-containing N-terminal plant-type domain-containing protein n=1 Tax=Acorus calamus TaxID=4465 RepID=A0AAV9CIR4_ACOCL|nr:hypothetical protein QJS10_CPB19g01805 [Acorus calamus]
MGNRTRICCFFLLLTLAQSKTVKRDVKALNEIKASLGWRVVYQWVGDDPCGDGDHPPWSGVTCSQLGDYRVVTELNLRWNKLQDVIPSEIGELKKLTHLYLSFNSLKGEIPRELANLPELRYLYLHENRLTGKIPPELGTIRNLRYMDVGNNHLVGTLRELISREGSFPSLRNLYLSYNKMSGSIPSELARIPKLTYLYLDHNFFTGGISDAFYKHPFLKELYIEGNQFRPSVKPKGVHKVFEVFDAELF